MSDKMNLEQKRLYLEALKKMIRDTKRNLLSQKIGTGANVALALYLLALSIINRFFSAEPNAFWGVATGFLALLNVVVAHKGLNEISKTKYFLTELNKEFTSVESMETE